MIIAISARVMTAYGARQISRFGISALSKPIDNEQQPQQWQRQAMRLLTITAKKRAHKKSTVEKLVTKPDSSQLTCLNKYASTGKHSAGDTTTASEWRNDGVMGLPDFQDFGRMPARGIAKTTAIVI